MSQNSSLPPNANSETDRRIQKPNRSPHLFQPIDFRAVTARNRIMVSPMCQYSAEDGVVNDWHLAHLLTRAAGGAGIVCVEATHVTAQGRITPGCLGLWNDRQRDGLARIAAAIDGQGAVPAIQIGHAGRKASTSRPWEGTRPLAPSDGGWETIAPSPIAQTDATPTPREMTAGDIEQVVDDFRSAARRAREAGFRILEIHGAHGYLIHSFLSPISNLRTDEFGGPLDNRMRLLNAVLDAVRTEWPDDLPLFVRLSVTDWVEGGLDVDASVTIAKRLAARGDVDLIDCSSGGVDPRQSVKPYPGYQVGFAERLRREADIATGAVGLISAPEHAEEILANGRADLVLLGRVLLFNPHWPLHAAKTLHADGPPWPLQYERGNIY
ncbi:NADH:flavin oxidoreductase/NADH oxidase [Fodinicurvata sp. EGI_FJ10296]|uniref:NADH:flavin oxidoreductase/NADH oxidase n=1 Tax=Fodinicurvata sp. EGI_FJ10296 TaxID=3231908 RepID=UPI0034565E57